MNCPSSGREVDLLACVSCVSYLGRFRLKGCDGVLCTKANRWLPLPQELKDEEWKRRVYRDYMRRKGK
jgi:CDP-diacylglycerol pyrophosphatase